MKEWKKAIRRLTDGERRRLTDGERRLTDIVKEEEAVVRCVIADSCYRVVCMSVAQE